MSTAFYPTNMRRQSTGGYSNNSTLENIPYVPWKGTGLFSNPIGVTATHIRPLTNMDPGNVFPTGFGLPRPIKHYRKGTVIPINFKVLTLDPTNSGQYIEQNLIEYNVNRAVKSSIASSLGGGSGGTGIISQMIDMPGSFIVKDNGTTVNKKLDQNGRPEVEAGGLNIDAECKSCNGVGIVSDWYPINNLSEKPQPNVTNPLLCCSQQRKAMRRVLPSNTNVKKNYFQTTYMYLYNRCQTFQQRQFNFIAGIIDPKVLAIIQTYPFVGKSILEYTKPGDPLSNLIYYVAQCNPNFTIERGAQLAFIDSLAKSLLNANFISQESYKIVIVSDSIQDFLNKLKGILNNEQYAVLIAYLYKVSTDPNNTAIITGPTNPKGCSRVYYKPNNPQYATQGGVSSSTRILKLNVDTISTAAARQRRLRGANVAAALSSGNIPYTPFIYKDKVPQCQAQTFIGNPFFFQGQRQNKLICTKGTNGAEYQTYNSVNSGSAGNYIGATQNA
jgi:hypothetical protein